MIDETIGYIALSKFTATASNEVKLALRELKAEGAKSLPSSAGVATEAVSGRFRRRVMQSIRLMIRQTNAKDPVAIKPRQDLMGFMLKRRALLNYKGNSP